MIIAAKTSTDQILIGKLAKWVFMTATIKGTDQDEKSSITEDLFYRRILCEGSRVVTIISEHPTPEQSPALSANEIRWYANRVMGMPSLLRKVFLVDLFQGLKVTFRYQDPKEIYTEQYPLERPQVAERYRGAPRLNVNPDTDETMCIACDLCALACPEHLIIVSSERNEKTRRKELTNFTYDLSRCMFCGLCEDACPTDALELTQDFELASYTREGWIWDRETLEKGPQPTQYRR
jgi:NADH-quinone oxidoreductase subunit I